MARGRISRFPIDLRRRPYNTLALPYECVKQKCGKKQWLYMMFSSSVHKKFCRANLMSITLELNKYRPTAQIVDYYPTVIVITTHSVVTVSLAAIVSQRSHGPAATAAATDAILTCRPPVRRLLSGESLGFLLLQPLWCKWKHSHVKNSNK